MRTFLLMLGCAAAMPMMAQRPSAKAPAFPDASTIVSEQPEGTFFHNQLRKATSWYTETGTSADKDNVDGYIADYVVQDDGTVWVSNPFTYFPTDSWLRLDRAAGDTLVARLPQAMYVSDEDVTYYATRMVVGQKDGNYAYMLPAYDEDYNVKFTLRGDTLRMIGEDTDAASGLPKAILGLATQAGGWSCYGEIEWEATPLGYAVATLPEGLTANEYTLGYTSIYGQPATDLVKVAISGNDVYMSDPVNQNDTVWIHGTLNDGKLSFTKQYVGADEMQGFHLFLAPGRADETSSEGYSFIDTLTMTLNAETGVFTAPENQCWIVNVGASKVYSYDIYTAPTLTPEKAATGTARPVNPVITSNEPYDAFEGGNVQFNLYATDVEGQTLAKSKLFYNIYLDTPDKPYVFSAEQYESLTEDMTDVPYSLDDQYDFFSSEELHKCYVYQSFSRLGVQAVYKGDNGTLRSDIVWTDNTITGLKALNATTGEGSTVWYNVDGTKAGRQHGPGLYIGKKADGSVVKVIRR